MEPLRGSAEAPANPFIEEGLLETQLHICTTLATVERFLLRESEGELGMNGEMWGVLLLVQGARQAADYVHNAIDEEDIRRRHSEPGHHCAADVCPGEPGQANRDKLDAALSLLQEYEARANSLSADQCIAELDRFEVDVCKPDDRYTIIDAGNTADGLRYTVARRWLSNALAMREDGVDSGEAEDALLTEGGQP